MSAFPSLGLLQLVAMLALLGCAEGSAAAPTTRPSVSLFERSWHWTDEQGADITLSAWRGEPLVVTAIYTSCATRCPLTIEKLLSLDAALRRKGIDSRFALVTLDPDVDDCARLRRFKETRHLPPSWHLLRGTRADTRELGRMLGVHAAVDEGHIDHDVRIVVFDASGRLVQTFGGWDFDEQAVAERL